MTRLAGLHEFERLTRSMPQVYVRVVTRGGHGAADRATDRNDCAARAVLRGRGPITRIRREFKARAAPRCRGRRARLPQPPSALPPDDLLYAGARLSRYKHQAYRVGP